MGSESEKDHKRRPRKFWAFTSASRFLCAANIHHHEHRRKKNWRQSLLLHDFSSKIFLLLCRGVIAGSDRIRFRHVLPVLGFPVPARAGLVINAGTRVHPDRDGVAGRRSWLLSGGGFRKQWERLLQFSSSVPSWLHARHSWRRSDRSWFDRRLAGPTVPVPLRYRWQRARPGARSC